MNEITVKKDSLLEALKANREDHGRIFEEALQGFSREVQAELEAHVQLLREGKHRTIYVHRVAPEDHTKSYDRAIRMLEMAIGDTVTLTEADFKCYVMDDWGWQGEFVGLANTYGSRTSMSKFGRDYDNRG